MTSIHIYEIEPYLALRSTNPYDLADYLHLKKSTLTIHINSISELTIFTLCKICRI
jgi:DNA-binding MarR family transcriptional regulator